MNEAFANVFALIIVSVYTTSREQIGDALVCANVRDAREFTYSHAVVFVISLVPPSQHCTNQEDCCL